ncbi:putative ribonuclease H-like domain-containing protein [Tanacetum coccineum]
MKWDQQVVIKKRVALEKLAKRHDQDSVHMMAASKVPMLKPENSNAPPITKLVEGVKTIIAPATAKEKAQRRLELKTRITLLIGIPNEHQLKFNSIKYAKSLLQAIEKSSEVLDQTFDRLQKLISQLEIHGESISQEDVNQKFLRKVKRTSSSNTNPQNVAFVSSNSTSSTNGAVNTAHGATIASTQATAVNSTIIDNLSDTIDLRWKMAMLTIRARRFLNNTGRKLTVNGNETIGFDKSKNIRSVPVETNTSNALISCDCLGDYDWSDQAKEGTTKFALIAYSSTSSNSKVSTDSNCLSSCLENVKILKEQNEQLLKDFRTSKINAITYKTGLESVEARLQVYKKNKSIYEEDIKIVDKCKTGLGYNAVPPPYIGNFMPPKPDLSYSGLEEFVNEPIVSEPTVKKPVVETSEAKASADKPKAVRKNNGAPIIEDWVSDSEEEDVPQAKKEKKTVKSSFSKIEFVKSKEKVKSPRKTTVKQGSNFEMINKACYVCGSFDHLQYDCDNHQRQFNNKKIVKPVWNYTQRVNHQNFSRMTHPNPKRNMVPKAVLMRSGLASLITARPVNTAQPRTTVNSARPMTNIFNKAHSTDINVNTARPKAIVNTARPKAVLNAVKGNQVNAVKASACWVWKPKTKVIDHVSKHNSASTILKRFDYIDAQDLEEKRVIDNGCSRHMTRNMSYLTDFEETDGGYVAFGGNPKGGKITGRGTIKTSNLDFENVYFVRELQFNLFSVSQMCDKKNSVLFNDTECIVLSPNFKLTDESHVLLKVPRKNNMYSVDLQNIIPKRGLTCLFVKATSDESKLWHRRLGHINFKTMNKLVKGNLVRGLPSKLFENDQTCVACQKGKQHRASYQRVKVIRCDNGTEFKNKEMNQFCERKGIKREFSVARAPQQNRVAKRKNRTLIEAARTMLADSKLPTTFWAEAVNTGCYVQNRVLVTKPHNKTPYELFLGRKLALGFIRPFGCPVTILNTIDHLGKFDGKADEGFFVGYSINSKAFRVFNSRTRVVEENLHVQISENTPNIAGSGPNWLFDIDALTKSMNYKPVVAENQSNGNAGTKTCDDAGKMETVPGKDYILLPLWHADPLFSQSSKSSPDAEFKPSGDDEKKVTEEPRKEDGDSSKEDESNDQEKNDIVNNTNNVNAASTNKVNAVGRKSSIELQNDQNMPELEDIVNSDDDEDVGTEDDMNNLDAFMPVNPIQTTRIHKDHPVKQIIRDLNSAPQTRRMTKNLEEHCLFRSVQQRTNHKDFQNCLFACFLSQEESKKVYKNKKDERGIVIKNKIRLVTQGYTQEEGINYDEVFAPVARIEAISLFLAYASFKDFMVYQMDVKSAFLYGKIEEEVYVCQPPGFEDPDFPDRRGKIDKTLFIRRDKGDILLVQVYVDDIIFGSTKKSLCTEFEKMMHKKFQMSSMGELTFFLGLQVKQKEDGIFISQDKYVTEILKKFGFTDVKTASTPMETQKPLLKDEDGEEVDVYLYRSMIGSLMYLTSSRPDIMFVVCACARYQVNPKVSHLHAVKRIFRYLKGQPKLGLWYPKDSPFDLVAYTDSDYAGASLDRKSTTGGCQFLGCRLISWQCKKQTVVANSTTEAEYVAASSCCGQVLWIQNQLLDYGDSNEKKLIQMIKIHTDKNVADLLTKAFDATVKVKTVNGEQQLQALVDGKKIVVTEASIRRDLQLDYEEGFLFSSMEIPYSYCFAMPNMVKNLDNAGKFLMYPRFIQVFLDNQLEGMSSHKRIYVTPSHTKKIFANMRRQGKDFSGRETPLFPTMVVQAQEEMGEGSAMPTDPHHTPIITQPSSSQPQRKQKSRRSKRKDTEVPQPSDPTNVADEAVNEEPIGRSARVVSSDKASLGNQEDASKQGRKIDDINADAGITLESTHFDPDTDMFGVHDLDGDEVVVESEVAAKKKDDEVNVVEEVVSSAEETVNAATITEDEITLAQALVELKSAKPKVTTATITTTKGILLQEPSESITTKTTKKTTTIPSKDKGKGIMVEDPLQMKKKDQISFDKQEAIRLQAEFDEQVRLAREKDEANIALIEEWNDIQDKIETNCELAQRLRKHFAAKRVEERRNRPPIRAQQRSIMCTYLKNMTGWKPKDLKSKSFANIQELFDKAFKRVNTFVDFRTETGDELEQENAKKQKVDDDQEAAKIEELMKIVPDKEEVAVDAIPLATKPPSIVDWKIVKEGKINYYQIIRADGSSKRYSTFIQMLKSFNKEDLETLWKLVKANIEEPKKVIHALKDSSWIEAMQEELLQFKLQGVWVTEVLDCKHTMETQKLCSRMKDGEACARYQVNQSFTSSCCEKEFLAYTDSDYAGASLDRKSTTGGCQFLGCRLISWQCKKQTVVANSTTEAEYVAASSVVDKCFEYRLTT